MVGPIIARARELLPVRQINGCEYNVGGECTFTPANIPPFRRTDGGCVADASAVPACQATIEKKIGRRLSGN